MGTIVQLQNKVTGENQYPRTYTTAVIDENATPLSTLMEQQDDKITELASEVIYDVSANNGGATFSSLSALLSSENLPTLIPSTVRCGGMSIRFVQSSDNKYVQYRLMSDTFNTTVANWQGVDDEPTAGSENLVKSGGVSEQLWGTLIYDMDISFSGGAQNKEIKNVVHQGDKLYIRILSNINYPLNIVIHNSSSYITIATISDTNYHKLDIPSDMDESTGLLINNNNSDANTVNVIINKRTSQNATLGDIIDVSTENNSDSSVSLLINNSVAAELASRSSVNGILKYSGSKNFTIAENWDLTSQVNIQAGHTYYIHSICNVANYGLSAIVRASNSYYTISVINNEWTKIFIPNNIDNNTFLLSSSGGAFNISVEIFDGGVVNNTELNEQEATKLSEKAIFAGNLSYSGGAENKTIYTIEANKRYYIRVTSVNSGVFNLFCSTTSGTTYLGNITANGFVSFVTPSNLSDIGLLLNYNGASAINLFVEIYEGGTNNQIERIEDMIDSDVIYPQILSYTGIQNKNITGLVAGELHTIQLFSFYDDVNYNVFYHINNEYVKLLEIRDKLPHTFLYPKDGNGTIIINHPVESNTTIQVSIVKNGFSEIRQYVTDLALQIANYEDYTNVFVVSATGTIGTDCDYNDIKSALDSATDGRKDNRYLIFVKNGTYDISNDGIFYLGLRNYVDIVGESVDGVVVVHRSASQNDYKSCFDTHVYPGIEYAMLSTMTLISYNCKGCFHSDYGGTDISKGGNIVLNNLRLINENPPTSNMYRNGIALGIINGRKITCVNCCGNVRIWAHNWDNIEYHKIGATLELIGCNCLEIGCGDLGSNANDTLILDGCSCTTLFQKNINDNVDGERNSWSIVLKGLNKIEYYLPQPNAKWYNKYPLCISGMHKICINDGESAINKGDAVSSLMCNSAGTYSKDVLEISVKPFDGTLFLGIAMDNIAVGDVGVIQYKGYVNIGSSAFSFGQYLKMTENGFASSTKTEADGRVVFVNDSGTFVELV